MASEAVKILIEAEDLASSKVAQAAAKIDQNVKKIKDVGGKAKASTEFIGQLAGQLGGSEISAFAGQLGGLTEKISQFAEVSKLGGAGALAFKAGLVGVVGALSYNIGKSIGDIVFETERWNKELEDAIANSERLTGKLAELTKLRISDMEGKVGSLDTTEQRREGLSKLIEQLQNDQREFNENIAKQAKSKPPIETWDMGVMARLGIETANEKDRKANDIAVEQNKAISQLYTDQIIGLQRKLTALDDIAKAEQKAKQASDDAVIRNLEQELALLQATEEEARKLKAQYAGLTGQAADRAVELMKQADEERKRQEIEKKAFDDETKRVEKEQSDRMRLAELVTSETTQLELRRVELEKGAEAAKALSLQMRGVPQAIAEQIAAEDVLLTKLEEEKKAKEQNRQSVTPNLQATEMRLLRFGGGNEQRQIAQATQASQKHLEFIAKLTAERAAREAREPRPAKVQDIRFREVL